MIAGIKETAELIKSAQYVTAFTGAGISVESGIPPFRGENGLWNRYNPEFLEISYFRNYPEKSWKLIKEIFYDYFGQAEPNRAHRVLARMEAEGILESIITQNIDNLHQMAGSKKVFEFHGHSRTLICTECGRETAASVQKLETLPPRCSHCGGLLKPMFVFFGEGIPEQAAQDSYQAARTSDVFLIIGSTGEIMPASMIPAYARENGARIIEVNIEPSNYTHTVTDLFLQGKATEIMNQLAVELGI